MKARKPNFVVVQEAEKEGKVGKMSPLDIPKTNSHAHDLSYLFINSYPSYNGMYGEEQTEDVLDAVNQYITDNNIKMKHIDMPDFEGSEEHLIPITPNLQLIVKTADEYYGGGDYEYYVEINDFIVNENTTTHDIDELINLNEHYLKGI